MSFPKSSVLVLGASGALGTSVMDLLISQRSSFDRIAILSDPSKFSKFSHFPAQGVEIVTGSFLDPTGSVYSGFDTLISLVGFDLIPQEQEIFTLAVKAGIRHFYASTFTSDLSQPSLRSMAYFGPKIANEEFFAQEVTNSYAKDAKVTIVYTGVFLEWVVKGGFYGVDIDKHVAKPYGRGDALISVTTMRDISRYIVDSILLPFKESDQSIRTIRVAGETVKFQSLMDKLGEAQGFKYYVEYLDPAIAKEKEENARKRGDMGQVYEWSVKPLAASGNAIVVGGGVDNGMFGFRPENVSEGFERLFGVHEEK